MTEITYHARLIGRHGPTVCIFKDLIMLEQWIKDYLVREIGQTIFVMQVRETVIKQISGKL